MSWGRDVFRCLASGPLPSWSPSEVSEEAMAAHDASVKASDLWTDHHKVVEIKAQKKIDKKRKDIRVCLDIICVERFAESACIIEQAHRHRWGPILLRSPFLYGKGCDTETPQLRARSLSFCGTWVSGQVSFPAGPT